MSMRINSSSNEMSPERLEMLLAESAWFRHAAVAEVQCEAVGGLYGKAHQLFTLRMRYLEGSAEQRPQRLFLKLGKSSKEHFFYTTIAQEMSSPPLPRCYHAAYDLETDQTCLLLEDLSETHFQTEWPLPPSAHLCAQIVQELAKMHAQWWDDPRLEGEFRAAIPKGRAWRERRALARQKLPEFIGFLGDRLCAARRKVYEQLLETPGELWEKDTEARGRTLLHGDLHVWNVFYPLEAGGSLYFFDWNMWDSGSPTDDLAYLLAVHWYPERRQRLELELLKAYHSQLVASGVSDYPWEALQLDYRLSVIRSLFLPVWQWVRGIEAGVWWSHLERVFLAFEDLKCSEIIQELNDHVC